MINIIKGFGMLVLSVIFNVIKNLCFGALLSFVLYLVFNKIYLSNGNFIISSINFALLFYGLSFIITYIKIDSKK